MSLPRAFLDQYDEPFGFMDFASVGALPRSARGRFRQFVESMDGDSGPIVPLLFEQIEATRALAADLVGMDTDHVSLVSSTSAGLFAAAFGLNGGSVVIPATDFPANLYPWIRAGEAGHIEPRFVAADDGRYTPGVLAKAVDSSTVAIAISQVDYQTGYRCDLEGLRELAGEALLIVDSVQALGALRSPMPHADIVVAGGQKWLRSGIGVAVLAMSDRALDRIDPILGGWLGVEDPFGLEVPMPHRSLDTPDRYTMGSSPIVAMAGLQGSLEALRLAPGEAVEETVLDRARAIEEEILKSDGELLAPWKAPSEKSGIVSFRLPDEPSTQTMERLTDAGFILTERNGWLRASPHATTHPDAPAAMGETLRHI